MEKIALLGAGGKMGMRLSKNLQSSAYKVSHVEISTMGRERLKEELNIQVIDTKEPVKDADYIILAVPDKLVGDVASSIINIVKKGVAIITLDAAAPYAGKLPSRSDVTYFCSHPCHPALFSYETDIEAQKDYFGGIKAKQGIVSALIQGPEEDFKRCEQIAKTIYAPVVRSHRCEIEHLAILEPALSETIGATLALSLREATDKAIAMGVPKAAAMDFMLGHLNIELSIAFNTFPEGKFSDGAILAINKARSVIFKNNWLDNVFDIKNIKKSVEDICKK